MATENARAIEAIVMVAEQPVAPELLAQLLEIDLDEVDAITNELMASYEVEDRGFILTRVAGGFRYQSHPDQAPYVERFVLEGQTARLSAAALETLAIVAYKQPLSRAQVAAIRGVNVDGVIRTLEQRGYIAEVARDPGPGNPILFGTTDLFLERLGINSLDDLPPIASFVPGPDVVEQLEHGLRAEIDPDVQAELGTDAATGEDASAPSAAADAGAEGGVREQATPSFGHVPHREPVGRPEVAHEPELVRNEDELPEDEPLAAGAAPAELEDAHPEDEPVPSHLDQVALEDAHPEDAHPETAHPETAHPADAADLVADDDAAPEGTRPDDAPSSSEDDGPAGS